MLENGDGVIIGGLLLLGNGLGRIVGGLDVIFPVKSIDVNGGRGLPALLFIFSVIAEETAGPTISASGPLATPTAVPSILPMTTGAI
ncbi:hypothetical protein ACPD1E_000271 [Vibrio cholerae]